MNPARISIGYTAPNPEEYRVLMQSVGFTIFPDEVAQKSLDASLFAVTLRRGTEVIGMARVVGDGICFAEVIDMVVTPAQQGQGHAKTLMQEIMDYVHREMAPGAFITLSAYLPADALYAQFGFEETAPEAVGMCYRVPGP